MKLKVGYILKKIAGENVLMFFDKELQNKVITLNETATFLFNLIAEGKDRDELVSRLLIEYDVDTSLAEKDVDAFINLLRSVGALED